MENLLNQIDDYKKLYIEKENELKILKKQQQKITEEIEEININRVKIIEEKTLLENSSKKGAGLARDVMQDISTKSLQSVFGDDREVVINLDTKAGQPTAELLILYDGDDTDPAKEEGGGVADIVSVTSFLALGDLLEGNMAPLFLDEPNKFLSKEYSEEMAIYLKDIVDYTGKQMFLVTHDEHLKTIGDKSFKTVKIGKTTQVEYLD